MKKIILLSLFVINSYAYVHTNANIVNETKCKNIIKQNNQHMKYDDYAVKCLSRHYVNEQKHDIIKAANHQLKDQKLLNITTNDGYIVYHYEYSDKVANTIDINLDKTHKLQGFCSNYSTNLLIRKGFFFRLIYTRPNNQIVYSVDINKKTCGQI